MRRPSALELSNWLSCFTLFHFVPFWLRVQQQLGRRLASFPVESDAVREIWGVLMVLRFSSLPSCVLLSAAVVWNVACIIAVMIIFATWSFSGFLTVVSSFWKILACSFVPFCFVLKMFMIVLLGQMLISLNYEVTLSSERDKRYPIFSKSFCETKLFL